MQKLLVKLFIKDYKNTSDIKVRSKYGTLSGVVGIITNLLLCTLKITLGIITASQSILADGCLLYTSYDKFNCTILFSLHKHP